MEIIKREIAVFNAQVNDKTMKIEIVKNDKYLQSLEDFAGVLKEILDQIHAESASLHEKK